MSRLEAGGPEEPESQTSQPCPEALVKSSWTIRSLKSRSPPPNVSSQPQVFSP